MFCSCISTFFSIFGLENEKMEEGPGVVRLPLSWFNPLNSKQNGKQKTTETDRQLCVLGFIC